MRVLRRVLVDVCRKIATNRLCKQAHSSIEAVDTRDRRAGMRDQLPK